MNVFSDISLWLLLPWFAISVVVAIWYYKGQKQLNTESRGLIAGLTSLRAAAIFLLGVFLYGILFETSESKVEKPVLITVIDNSASLLNYKDSSEVKEQINKLTKRLTEKYSDRFSFDTYIVDSEVRTAKPDLKGEGTNLDAAFEHIYNQYYNRNIGGVCFISDGNYNKGNSPIYTAGKLGFTPVFTIGVGDTVMKRDQLIRNVAANEIAFLKNKFPIEIDIEASKIGKEGSVLELFHGDELIASEQVNYTGEEIEYKHISFLIEANQVGFVNYTVKLKPVNNEVSLKNNEKTFFIEVIDSRSKVLILSNAPHPDVTAIKQVLAIDENIEVTSELLEEWDGTTEGVELIVWHGAGKDNGLNSKLKAKIPVFYCITNGAKQSIIDDYGLGLKIPGSNRLDEVQASIETGFQLFDLSEKVEELVKRSPALHVNFGTTNQSAGSTLLTQRVGPVKKKDPVLYFGNRAGVKYGVLVGEGLWRWKLGEYSRTSKNEGFNELIQKSMQYLLVKKNTEPLRVSLPKRFTVNEAVIINAEFYNASLEPTIEPEINFNLIDEQSRKTPYVFAKNSKDYILSLGKLSSGKYKWEATSTYGGKSYTKNGEFIVESISLESLSTSSNFNLLESIAEKTNGAFFQLSDSEALIKHIDEREDIVNVSYEETQYNDLIDIKWLFLILVLLLGIEWFLRRYYGAY